MAITDIFKKEEKKEIAAKKSIAEKKDKKDFADKEKTAKKSDRKLNAQSAQALINARVTEKAARLGQFNQYVFDVAKKATKKEVAKAIESYYGVDVVKVNISNIAGKRKRRGRNIIVEPGYRKAVVEVKKGQSIEVMPQ